jgi:hypothetical protein
MGYMVRLGGRAGALALRDRGMARSRAAADLFAECAPRRGAGGFQPRWPAASRARELTVVRT